MGIWEQAKSENLQKKGDKAVKRRKPLKVYSSSELQWYIEHGWTILSHNPVSYGAPQFWLLSAPQS